MKYILIWLIKISSVLFAFGQTLVLAYTWFTAFLHGDRVMVYINLSGEKYPELLMWIICLPIFCYGIYLVVRELWKEAWRNRKQMRRVVTKVIGLKPVMEPL